MNRTTPFSSRSRLQHLVDPQTSHAHTGAYAHGVDEDLLLLPPHLREASDNLSGTSGTERMTESDTTIS